MPQQGSNGGPFANTAAALAAARAAAASGVPYSTAVAQSGVLAGFRQDCSGLADYILSKAGVNVGQETTVGLAQDPQLTRGQGSITLWDIPLPGQQGHVIEDIGGQWFESGGITGGGPHQMTAAQAAQELGVSDLSQLPTSGPTSRGFIALTPTGGSTPSSLAALWIQAGGDPRVANTMAAIAMAESGGQVSAQNPSGAAGLWQILPSAHPQYNVSELLSDPLYNAQAAVAVYNSQGFNAWSTYTSGAYRQFLGRSNVIKGYGGTRPGGQPVGSGNGGGSSGATGDPATLLSNWETLRDTPRTAPPGTANPFKWWLASFTGNWNNLAGGSAPPTG